MTLLAAVGAVVITSALIYFTLGFVILMLLSDENLWNTIKWNWKDIVPEVIVITAFWWAWWFFIGSRIMVGFS